MTRKNYDDNDVTEVKKRIARRGQTWVGYYPRKTKTRREKEIACERKQKHDYYYDDWD